MKKSLVFIFLLLSQLSMYAERVEIDGIMYDLHQGSEFDENTGAYIPTYNATVTYKDNSNDFFYNFIFYTDTINIPESIEYLGYTYSVDQIDAYAFRKCSTLISVTIPSSIKAIGSEAFSESGITSIAIPSNVNYFGSFIFSNCQNLIHAILPDDMLTIPVGMFDYCIFLESVKIPLSVEILESRAFFHCESLKNIELPNGLVALQANALDGCTSLSTIEIPSTVTLLGEHCFSVCTSLKSFNFPEGITTISNNIFEACSNLEHVYIPNSVISIGSNAFHNCYSLQSLYLPTGLISIGEHAFQYCRSLKEIELPKSIARVNNNAFEDCTNLIIYNYSSTEIECSDQSVRIYNDCSQSGDYLFTKSSSDCPLLAKYTGNETPTLVLPESYEGKAYGINERAFEHDSVISKVTFPQNLISVGNSSFKSCVNLSDVNLPSSVAEIGPYAFYDCPLSSSSLTFGENIIQIGQYAFNKYMNSSRILANAPFQLGENSFNDITTFLVHKDKSTDFQKAWPDYKWQIVIDGETDFDVTVTADNNASAVLKAITDGKADSYAYNVVNLKVAGTINSYDVLVFREKLLNLHHLDLSSARFVDSEQCWSGNSHTIEDEIAPYTFYDMPKLFTLKIPESAKAIGDFAISGCANLTSLTIPNSVTSIGRYALHNLQIEDISLPQNINFIGDNAFNGCKRLERIALPSNIEAISEGLFNGCNSLKNVELGSKIASIGQYAFYDCSNLDSIVIPANVSTIANNAFGSCSKLRKVVFPKYLDKIGSEAFANCTNLEAINLPSRLKTIEHGAFKNCQLLTEIKLPASLTSLGTSVFNGCTNVKSIYTWTIAPIKADLSTFDTTNFEESTLYVPEAGQSLYYYNTDWMRFRLLDVFNEPYEYFYLDGDDLVLDNGTVRIDGENGANPDADFSGGAGLIVEGTETQGMGEVSVDASSSIISQDTDDPNITINRFVIQINILKDRWYFFCFPFNVPKNNISFNGQFQWCYYDGEYRAENGSGAWRDAEGDLEAYKGYIFQGSKDGILSIEVENVSIGADDAMIALESYPASSPEDASWNLVGNPFTSYYYLSDLGYTAPITIWNPISGTYEAYNPQDDDILLHPYEAFFVQKTNDDESIDFDNESQNTYMQTQNEENRLGAMRRRLARACTDVERLICNIEVSDGSLGDRTRVVFNEQSGLDYEIGRDAAKFMSDAAPQLYTLDYANTRYSINERPLAEGVVRLGFAAAQGGSFVISAPRLDLSLYLIDFATGKCTDLSAECYEFDASRGAIDDRFLLSTEPSLSALRDKGFDPDSDANYYDLRGINRGHDLPSGLSIRQDGRKQLNLQ